MCGICGIIYRDSERPVDINILEAMSQKIIHRGPDDDGYFVEKNFGMAMRRLSIIDIAGGKQPIYNEDESIVTVYNGEIYNYQAIKQDLKAKGHIFKTNSDTEILVHLYEEYGKKLLEHLNGMFAFAVYDRKRQQLLLARDRLGIKPIYYIYSNDWFLFSSEIKSFLAFPEFYPALDFEALHHYLTFRFVPAPMTLFKKVRKLPPGFLIEYRLGRNDPDPKSYWDLSFERNRQSWSGPESAQSVRAMVHDAVRIRLMSEVPLGVMLSGGVDSSTVVSSIRKKAEGSISTFTIIYEEEGDHNEGVFAKMTAETFQTDHHEIKVRLDDFFDSLERMVFFMDEPIADPAAIPIFDLCRFSKEYVTVLLSGVGGDELFAGYDVYREAIYSNYFRYVPLFAWKKFILPVYSFLPKGLIGKNFVNRVHQPIEDVFLGSSFIYGGFSESEKVRLYTDDFAQHQLALNSHDIVRQTLERVSKASTLHKMMYLDTKRWLADSHLIMMDKMSMANSIEMRAPFLDHRLVEMAAAMPEKFKINLLRSKIALKNAFSSEVPSFIINRPKQGFSTPLNIWFKKPGVQLADFLITNGTLIPEYFNKGFITEMLSRHVKKEGDFSASLFTLLVLAMWLKNYITK